MRTSRFYNGHPVAFRKVSNRRWIGGRGHVCFTEYLVWNPANPNRTVLLSASDFFELTTPAVSLAA